MKKNIFYKKSFTRFFVNVLSFSITLALLLNSSEAHSQNIQFSKLSILLQLNLEPGSANTADGVVALFAKEFSADVSYEDSYKFTNIDENLAIARNGKNLSIEGRPDITTTDTLPLRIWKFRQKSYFFKMVGSNFPSSINAIIIDKYKKTSSAVSLSDTTIVPFSITSDSASFAADRFSVILRKSSTLPVVIYDAYAYTKNRGVQIEWKCAATSDVVKFEIEKSADGTNFKRIAEVSSHNNALDTNYNWFDANAFLGNCYYRIKMLKKSGNFELSTTMKVSGIKLFSNFSIYPNPLKGNVLNLQLNSLQKGSYLLSLYNMQGQKIYSMPININSSSLPQSVALSKQLAKGFYTLQITNGYTFLSKQLLLQ